MKKQLREWAVIIGIIGLLYVTGWHTEIAGFLQRAILSTGVMQADLIAAENQKDADYNFKLIDERGQIIDFNQFEGQTVFLNFWATWCPPCIAEMPDIHDLYIQVKDENVAFVLISQDEQFDKAKNFLERKKYTFPIYQLASRLPEPFSSRSIPVTFVLSPEGKIIAKRTGMAKYDTEEFRNLLIGSKL